EIDLTVDKQGRLQLRNPERNEPYGLPMPHQGQVQSTLLTADGKALVACGQADRFWLYQIDLRRHLGIPLEHDQHVLGSQVRLDGKIICSEYRQPDGKGAVQLWDRQTGRPLGKPLHDQGLFEPTPTLFFNRDEKIFLTGLGSKTAHLWSTSTGQPLGRAFSHGASITTLGFAANEEFVFTIHEDEDPVWKQTRG